MKALTVSVVIITRDRPEMLLRAIDSLCALPQPPLEVIIADNSAIANDATRRAIVNRPRVRYTHVEPTRSFLTRSRNCGLRLARGDIVAFVDDDVTVYPTWLEGCVEAYTSDEIGGVGGRILDPEVEKSDHQRNVPICTITADGQLIDNLDCDPGKVIEVEHLRGCNFSVRRDVLWRLGGFDEHVTGYAFDELDFLLRLRKAGYKLLFNPRMALYHHLAPRFDQSRYAGVRFHVRYRRMKIKTYIYYKTLYAGRNSIAFRHLWRGDTGILALFRRPSLSLLSYVVSGYLGKFAGVWRYLNFLRSRRDSVMGSLPPLKEVPPALIHNPDFNYGSEPPVSIVIITRHRPHDVRKCLASLEQFLSQHIKVILVDNSDNEATAFVAQEFPWTIYVRVPYRRNFQTATRNCGLRLARAPIVAYLDDDVTVSPTWLAACLEGYSNPAAGGVGGRVLDPEVDGFDHKRDEPICTIERDGRLTANLDCDPGRIVEVEHLRGCNFSVRRQVALTAGGFDEQLKGYGYQDLDLLLRIQRIGYKILFHPQMEIYHHLAPREGGDRWGRRFHTRLHRARNLSYVYMKTIPRVAWRYVMTGDTGILGLFRNPSTRNFNYVLSGALGKFGGVTKYWLSCLRRSIAGSY